MFLVLLVALVVVGADHVGGPVLDGQLTGHDHGPATRADAAPCPKVTAGDIVAVVMTIRPRPR